MALQIPWGPCGKRGIRNQLRSEHLDEQDRIHPHRRLGGRPHISVLRREQGKRTLPAPRNSLPMIRGHPINWMVVIKIVFSSENMRLSQTASLDKVVTLRHGRMATIHHLSRKPVPNETSTGSHRNHCVRRSHRMVDVHSHRHQARYLLRRHLSLLVLLTPGTRLLGHSQRVLRYLKGTLQHGLTYPRSKSSSAEVIGYADSLHLQPQRQKLLFRTMLPDQRLPPLMEDRRTEINSYVHHRRGIRGPLGSRETDSMDKTSHD